MGITDKVSGKVKQAAGDIAGDASLRREGNRKHDYDQHREHEVEKLAKDEPRDDQAESEEHGPVKDGRGDALVGLQSSSYRPAEPDCNAGRGRPSSFLGGL